MKEAVGAHPRLMLLGILAGLVWAAARVSVPLLAGEAIDHGIARGRTNITFALTAAIVAVGAVQAIGTGLRRYAAFGLAWRVETDIRMKLVAHLQRLHFAFHDQAQTGQLMAYANTDIQQINNVVLLVPLTIASTIQMAAVVVILVLRSPGLALFALGLLPLLNFSATRFNHRMYPVGMQLQKELSDVSGVVEESVTGVRVVKGFGVERMQRARLSAEADSVYDRSMDQARLRARFMPLIDLLPALGLVGILWYGGHQVLHHRLTVGDIVSANLFVVMLIWPLRMIGMLVGQLPRSAAAAGRIDSILATDPAIEDAPNARALPDGPGAVRFERVTFGYGRGPAVLDGLDLVIEGGEAVALVGATASGKTTVARLIPRFYDVHAGHVRIDGADVRDVRLSEVRRSVGLVFEDTFLFSDSVRNNIAFADPEAPNEAVARRSSRAPTSSSASSRGLRLDHRRARVLALRRAAPAHRDRPCGARRPAHPDPRRRHVVGRPDEGARDPGRAGRGDAGPDDDHHRAPARDDRAGRPGRAARRRQGRGRRHARATARHVAALPGGARTGLDRDPCGCRRRRSDPSICRGWATNGLVG